MQAWAGAGTAGAAPGAASQLGAGASGASAGAGAGANKEDVRKRPVFDRLSRGHYMPASYKIRGDDECTFVPAVNPARSSGQQPAAGRNVFERLSEQAAKAAEHRAKSHEKHESAANPAAGECTAQFDAFLERQEEQKRRSDEHMSRLRQNLQHTHKPDIHASQLAVPAKKGRRQALQHVSEDDGVPASADGAQASDRGEPTASMGADSGPGQELAQPPTKMTPRIFAERLRIAEDQEERLGDANQRSCAPRRAAVVPPLPPAGAGGYPDELQPTTDQSQVERQLFHNNGSAVRAEDTAIPAAPQQEASERLAPHVARLPPLPAE
eukprot:g597.t1